MKRKRDQQMATFHLRVEFAAIMGAHHTTPHHSITVGDSCLLFIVSKSDKHNTRTKSAHNFQVVPCAQIISVGAVFFSSSFCNLSKHIKYIFTFNQFFPDFYAFLHPFVHLPSSVHLNYGKHFGIFLYCKNMRGNFSSNCSINVVCVPSGANFKFFFFWTMKIYNFFTMQTK